MIVLDENICYALVEVLRSQKKKVFAIAEPTYSGWSDEQVYQFVVKQKALLVTRDHHFTNSVRFLPENTGGIIYIRIGNLRCEQEIKLIMDFLAEHSAEEISGKVVTLSPGRVHIR